MNRLWTDAERARVRDEVIRTPYAKLQDIGARLAVELDRPPKGISIMAGRLRSEMRIDPPTPNEHASAPEPPTVAPCAPDDAAVVARITALVLEALRADGNAPLPPPREVPARPVQLAREAPTHGREIALFDIHHPHNIPLGPVFDFIRDYHPDVVILGGDALDAGPFSHWNKGKTGILRALPLPTQMFADFVSDVLVPLRRAAGDSCYIAYLLGNHEDWCRQAIEDDPRGDGFWNVELNLGGIPDAVIPYVTPGGGTNLFRMGRLWFMHGSRANKYHAAAIADEYARPIRYGHVHDVQQYSKSNAIDVRDFHVARSCGCLCDRNPSYARSRPNRWVHALQYGEVDPDGSFWDEVPIIVNGEFHAAGARYREAA